MLPALPTGMQWYSGGLAEHVADLEGARLLPLDAIRVHRVDEGDGHGGRSLPHDVEGDVEVARDGDHVGAVGHRLGELAHGDLALGDDDDRRCMPALAA